jgi:hypothetical protein
VTDEVKAALEIEVNAVEIEVKAPSRRLAH